MSYLKWIFAVVGYMRGGIWASLMGFWIGSTIENIFRSRKHERQARDFFNQQQAHYQRHYQQYQQQYQQYQWQQQRAYQQAQQQQSSLARAYQTLGISPNASDDQVRQAYRKLALQYHPDRVATMDESVRQEAQRKFQQVTEARDQIFRSRGL